MFVRKKSKKNDIIFFDDVSIKFIEMIKFKNFRKTISKNTRSL